MPDDLGEALDALDLAVSRAADLIDPQPLEPYARIAKDARSRTGFLGETVVVALAGGTGSGKSSLLNAIAGARVAETGPIRPTTERPLAWLPASPEPGLVRLLDELEVQERVGQTRLPHLAVIDLPDTDSVVEVHRDTVERLLPRVDAVIWIVDPEKYHDRLLHAEYLRPLAGYQGQFLFVLNQIDRLDRRQHEEVRRDLLQALHDDGITAPVVFSVAADPPGSPPEGARRLLNHLEGKMEAKRVALGKLIEDIRRASAGIAEVSGVTPGAGLDFDRRWEQVGERGVDRLAEMLAGGEVTAAAEESGERLAMSQGSGPLGRLWAVLRRSRLGRALGATPPGEAIPRASRGWTGRAGLEQVLADTSGLVAELSFETGGAFGARLREEWRPERLEREVRASVEGVLAHSARPRPPQAARWWRAAALLQVFLLAAVAAAAVWIWAQPESLRPGRWPWPLLVGWVAAALGAALAALVRRSGRTAGRRAAGEYRAEVRAGLEEQLTRRVAIPLRALLRARAELGATLAELGVLTAAAGRRLR